MLERANKTLICSVVFLDIVEYSKKSVAEQIKLKERFNAIISEAIKDVAPSDRLILDTGDGAAINFLGDPEDALFVAMKLRDAVFAASRGDGLKLLVRIGINLGPVRLVKDINGQPNIIGDGINMAQRVMSFSVPGQVLISRSFYDVISRMSPGYAQFLHYQGARADKHVREHEIYAVGTADGAAEEPSLLELALKAGIRPQRGSQTGTFRAQAPQPAAPWWQDRKIWYWAAPAGIVAVAVLALALRGGKTPEAETSPAGQVAETQPVAPQPEAAAPVETPAAREPVREPPRGTGTAAPAAARPQKAPAAAAEKPHIAEARKTPVAPRKSDAEAAAPAPAAPPPPAPAPAPQAAPSPAGTAYIGFAITPWGEVYVDGKLQGISPPLGEIQVSAEKHEVEIRNTSFASYTKTVDLKSGERIKIKHKF